MAMNWLGRDIPNLMRTLRERYADRPALVAEPGSWDESGSAVTFRSLEAASYQAAASLSGLGIRPGDRVAILAENSVDWVAAWFGASVLGAVLVPLNTRLTWREIEFQLEGAAPKVLLADDPHPGSTRIASLISDKLRSDNDGLKVRWLRDQVDAPFPSLRSTPAGDMPVMPQEANSGVGMIQFTSGSTASPKGAMLRQDALIAVGGANASRWLVDTDDVFLGALPLYHNGGSVFTLLSAFAAGASVALMSQWSGPLAAEICRTRNVSVLSGVETVLRDLASLRDSAGSSLRLLATAGTPQFCAELVDLFDVEVINVYGLTECSPTVASGDLRDSQDQRIEVIGLPHPGIELRICDESGPVLGAGERGEIQVRGWNVMPGYLEVAGVLQPFTPDGWLITGDVGSLDGQGYLSFHGRSKDVVKSGGENVSALEVETYLKQHARIEDAAVVGVEDSRWGEMVVAYVRPISTVPDLLPEVISAYCRDGLAGFKSPKRIIIVSEFPLTGSGKISKPILRQWASEPLPDNGSI